MYPSTSKDIEYDPADPLCPPPSAPLQPPLEPPPISVPPSFNFEYPIKPATAILAMNKDTSDQNIIPVAPKLPSSHSPGPWSSGLCDCCNDIHSCCLTCCCPCVTFGRIAEIVDRGSTSCGVSGALYAVILWVTGCSCLYSCFYRSKLRGQYLLDERPCIDCCVHCCCEECALCQEYRELKHQGFDMSMGWHGNMVRLRRCGLPVPPVVEGGMRR